MIIEVILEEYINILLIKIIKVSKIMKKLLVFLVMCICCLSINAQIIRTEELEKYAVYNYGSKWTEAAENLKDSIVIDKNDGMTFVDIIPVMGKTKDEIYISLNYWFTATFNDANSVIKLNDRELGTIIAEGFISNIASHSSLFRAFDVSIKTIIKCDIKDNKVRVTYSVPYYELSILTSAPMIHTTDNEKWIINECFPFRKDSHKKTSSKALVMAYAYSKVIMDKINECVIEGLNNENDNW